MMDEYEHNPIEYLKLRSEFEKGPMPADAFQKTFLQGKDGAPLSSVATVNEWCSWPQFK